MGIIVNELTWSSSRASLFQSCPRQYYYKYYGSWGGWDAKADEKTRLLYQLKNIKPMILWAGSIVHDTIKDSLLKYMATGSMPTAAEMQESATLKMRSGWVESVGREWEKSPKKTNLFELYYGDGENYGQCKKLPREFTDAIKQRVMDALAAFSFSPAVKEILTVPCANWKTIDDASSYFMLDDIKVWAIIDFAYIGNDGILHIIDWKTGKEHPAALRVQLACYALYAMSAWQIPVDRIAVHGVLLNDGGRRSDYTVDQALIDAVSAQIRVSYGAMRAKLKDAENNLAEEGDFMCNPSEYNCGSCPFLRVCPKE